MAGRYRFALAPRWWVGHLLVTAAVVAMVLLGRWQLHVSEHKGFSLQNFGYALQWWAFSVFAVFMWVKIIRDVGRHRPAAGSTGEVDETVPAASEAAEQPVHYRRYVPPTAREADDPVTARYNEYLAELAQRDEAAKAAKAAARADHAAAGRQKERS